MKRKQAYRRSYLQAISMQAEHKLVNFITMYELMIGIRNYKKAVLDASFFEKKAEKNLKQFVRYIYRIPFYRKRFRACGLKKSDIQKPEDLKKLPVLTKEEYRQWIVRETKKNPAKYRHYLTKATSGSTGKPLKLYVKPKDTAFDVANNYRTIWIQGRNYPMFRGKVAEIQISDAGPHIERHSFVQKLGLFRTYKISVQEGYAKALQQFNRIKPDFIWGYKSEMLGMFQYAREHGIACHPVRCAASRGEQFDPAARRIIDEAFGRPSVFDVYGSEEVGLFAADRIDTPGHYMVWQDTHAVRVVDGVRNTDGSVTGQIAVTSYFHKAFPVVNYLLEDTVTLKTENHMQYITAIQGRCNDYVYGFSGKKYGGKVFWDLLNILVDCANIVRQHRIVQDRIGYLNWYIVLDRDCEAHREMVRTMIHKQEAELLNNDFAITILWKRFLRPDGNGKMRLLTCHVSQEVQFAGSVSRG